jgi:hypothetical protein
MWRARIHYDALDHSYWFTPLPSCPAFHTPASVVVPSRRRDIFVQLGERGNTAMSWPLQAGDGFRIGHTYVIVLRILHHSVDPTGSGARALAALQEEESLADRLGSGGGGGAAETAVGRLESGSPPSAEDESDDAILIRKRVGAAAAGAGGESGSAGGETDACDDDSDGVVFGDVRTLDGDMAECCFCYEVRARVARARAMLPPALRGSSACSSVPPAGGCAALRSSRRGAVEPPCSRSRSCVLIAARP